MHDHHLLRASCWSSLLLGTMLTLPAVGSELAVEVADPAAAALALSHSATNRAEMDAAVSALLALLPRYPQDVEIPLQLAWLMFRTGRYSDALYSYQMALTRSTPGSDAELGLAWALVKLGRCAEARGHFQAVLLLTPEQTTAQDGLRECSPSPQPAPCRAPAGLVCTVRCAESVSVIRPHPVISYATAPTAPARSAAARTFLRSGSLIATPISPPTMDRPPRGARMICTWMSESPENLPGRRSITR